ncbi:MAG: DUF4440 domain-containing protein [Candidatus Marinimicrobia bacterium]|nr:DUF4440 domain-containing protein [Candidatus Neomarinimicrobiota bacterium]
MNAFKFSLSIFLSGFLLISSISCNNSGQQDTNSDETKLNAIRNLHQEDQRASRDRDLEALVALWTDDAALLPPNNEPVVGKDAIREWISANLKESSHLTLHEYDQNFEEIKVVGRFAFEWGSYSGAYVTPSGDTLSTSGKLMRILKQQSNGEWKVYRAIWH